MASATENTHQKVSSNVNTDQCLKSGMNNEKVNEIQIWLKSQRFYNGRIDGQFGPFTEEAVKNFQEESGIKVDGIVGSQTIRAMDKWETKANNSMQKNKSSKNSVKKYNSKTTSTLSKKASYGKKNKNYARSYNRKYSRSSGWGYINGMDCWAMSDYIASKYSGKYQTRIRHAATSYSSDHRWVEINDGSGWHAAPDYGSLPKIYTPTYR